MFARIVSGIVMGAFAISVLIMGETARMIALALIMAVSQYEMTKALRTAGHKLYVWPGYVFVALFIPAFKLFGVDGIWAVFALLVMAVMCVGVFARQSTELSVVFSSFQSFIYPLSLFVFLLLSAALPGELWRSALLTGIAVACITDSTALFVGLKFGRTKLAPSISPKKTVEGAVGGFVGGVVAGILVFAVQGIWHADVAFWVYMLAAVTGSIAGQAGDLVASAVKRETGIKDFGNLIPGHGGVLDRMDSILFSMPMAYIFFGLFAA